MRRTSAAMVRWSPSTTSSAVSVGVHDADGLSAWTAGMEADPTSVVVLLLEHNAARRRQRLRRTSDRLLRGNVRLCRDQSTTRSSLTPHTGPTAFLFTMDDVLVLILGVQEDVTWTTRTAPRTREHRAGLLGWR
ncbi:hypothetical protein [Nonomuraea dietziae]|uniref:Uncharacterized protein n=1 Tax=Nonomuraea dietziae TaxID=65515 RepID=A0A7W5Y8J1_9ACTN|nr:hypothetical protein [Nonomuraea dietziae]MBB3724598.1 hypothetical protein [Nonomuraea dietziae]